MLALLMTRARLAYLALGLAALLFGSTFVAVKESVKTLPPMGFVGWRFLLGAADGFFALSPRLREDFLR